MLRTRANHRRLIGRVFVLAVACIVMPAPLANAGHWMFRPSYFSHATPPELAWKYPVPTSYSAYRPAIVSPYPGFGLQGVTRFNNVAIPSGASFDYTLMRSDTFQQIP